MTILLDAGAFAAVERQNRDVAALLKRELVAGRVPVTHGGIVAQVWRGGTRKQHELARLLPAVDVAALDEALGRRAGVLLGAARRADAIDAALVILANHGDAILTSDPDDLDALARAAHLDIDIFRV